MTNCAQIWSSISSWEGGHGATMNGATIIIFWEIITSGHAATIIIFWEIITTEKYGTVSFLAPYNFPLSSFSQFT